MASYLNREDVRTALHTTTGQPWTQADEVGPVAAALLPDWTVNSDQVVEELLRLKLSVRMYNGVRDVSSCNHMGNLEVISHMKWDGAAKFAVAKNVPWPSASQVEGYIRTDSGDCASSSFCYATVLRTGHLVPTVVPAIFAQLLEVFLA
jgi:carboxypeptidase C (cathepsin A)